MRLATLFLLLIAGAALAADTARERLVAAGWAPEVASRIAERLATARGRVVAVFDHDGTLMHGDVTMGCGTQPGVLREMLQQRHLAPAGLAQIASWMEPDPWAAYCAWTTREPMRAYGWLPTVLAGQSVAAIEKLARERYRDTYRRWLFPEMQALLAVLRDAGVEIYVVSASAQPLLEAAAPWLGIPRERVFGIHVKEKGGVYLPEIEPPPSYASGKVWVIEHRVRPSSLANLLTFGDSYVSDGPMLRLAARHGGVGVLIDPPPDVLPKLARDGLLHQTFASHLRFAAETGPH